MTEQIDIADLRAKLAARKGPWEIIGGGEYVAPVGILVAPDDGGVGGREAELIVAAVNVLPALLDEIERLRTVTDEQGDVLNTATAEANGRYASRLIEGYDEDRYDEDEYGYDATARQAFVAGALWQAGISAGKDEGR